MTVSIFSDVVCELGEGPGFHAATGRMWWFDILGKRLLERRADRSGTTVHDLPVNGSILADVDGIGSSWWVRAVSTCGRSPAGG